MFLQPPNSSSPVLPFFLPGVSLSSYAQPQPLPRLSLDLKPQTPRPQSSLCCSLWQGRGVQENGAVKAGLPGRRTLAVGGTTSASAAVTTSSSQDPDAAGLVPKARPPQRRPESAGFVSSASLTATLLRTATNISVTAVTETLCFKFTVTEACGEDRLGTTLADFPLCLVFLPKPPQSRHDGHHARPHPRAVDCGCALAKL